MSKRNIAIIGNGVYGRALWFLFSKKHDITIFWREIKNDDERLIDDFVTLSKHFDYLIISITTKGLSDLLPKIFSSVSSETHIILAMKWLTANGLLPIDECRKFLPSHRISILSGPGFAEEIMSSIPVHLVLASDSLIESEEEDFLVDNLTLDFTTDIMWVSLCGVLKNIYAIGAGMASKNTGFDRAAYTQGAVHEMSMILESMGYKGETAHGPAGRGDMWVCTTPHSRNFRFWAGDDSLRDQAEWYNAIINCKNIIESLWEKSECPIIREIIRSVNQ